MSILLLFSSAISVELYYIFSTLWGREQYTLYGILLVVFLILLSVTASISVALTYFQLSSEDYRWWWKSIFCAGYECYGYYNFRRATRGVLRVWTPAPFSAKEQKFPFLQYPLYIEKMDFLRLKKHGFKNFLEASPPAPIFRSLP